MLLLWNHLDNWNQTAHEWSLEGPLQTLGFCSDMKFKMAATAGLSLTLDPKGKMFQNASSLKPLGQLKPNCPGMIIGRSSTKFLFFYADRKSKIDTTAGHRLTLDPMGKCSNAFFSETTNMIKAKLYMNVHWKVLYKLYVFVPIWNSKWRLRQNLV